MFTTAILAGGQARRLGGIDKASLRVGSDTILGSQLTLLRRLTPHILIVSNDIPRFADAGVPVVPDAVAGTGALGGPYTALVHAPTDPVLVIACGMPFLTAPFLTHLVNGLGDAEAIVLDALDDLSVREIDPDELATLDPDGRLLVNVNTPDDYRDAHARITQATD